MRPSHNRIPFNAVVLAAVSTFFVLATEHSAAQVIATGGCDTYSPDVNETVTCDVNGTNPDDTGVQTPKNNTTINGVTVNVDSDVVLAVSGSTIGLGAGTTVDNRGTLRAGKLRFAYGVSAGVNGRSMAGGNTVTNRASGVVLTQGSDAHGIYINARQSDAADNVITNAGTVTTTGSRADGIRLYTSSTAAQDSITNSGSITTSGVSASGIHVQNNKTQTAISNSGTIVVNDASGYGILIDGAANVTNSGTIQVDPSGYALYVEDNGNTNANTLTIALGSDIMGALRFSSTRTAEKLIFATGLGTGSGPFELNNTITGLNQVEVKSGSEVTLGADSYDLVDAVVTTESNATLEIAGDVSGTGGLVKDGLGQLRLSGANSYVGGTALQAGTIVAASDQALGTGALEAGGADVVLLAGKRSVALDNAVTLSADLIVDTVDALMSLSGDISGAGGLTKRGSGTLVLAGQNAFLGDIDVEAGTLALGASTASSTGEVIMSADTTLQANNNLTVDNVFKLRGPVEFNTQAFAVTLNGAISNKSVGQLIKTGSGTLTLNAIADYTGGTIVQEGVLAIFGNLISDVTVQSGAVLGGSGTVTGDVTNAGTIQPRLNGSRSTLTIVGDYMGQDGIFASTLGGTSQAIEADRLAVQGSGNSVSGLTTVIVSDPTGVLGKPTVGDGILLVDVAGGATSTATAFTAPRIAAGAYEYELVRGGENSTDSWYLRADEEAPEPPVLLTPEVSQREEVALYPALPSLARQYLLSINGTLDDRRGAPDVIGQWNKQPLAWGRLIANHNKTKPGSAEKGPGINANDWGLQLGVDLWRHDNAWGQWRAGPVMTIGRSTGGAYNSSGSVQTGDISLNAYSLGLNATVANDQGAYADVLVLGTRLTGVEASSPLGTSINTTGWALSGSIEGGWRLPLNEKVAVTPQAQVYTTTVNLQEGRDAFSVVQMPTQTTVLGRLGLKLSYDNIQPTGPRTQFWARASVYSNLSGREAATSFLNLQGGNATTFQSQAPGTWMALDAAVNVQATESTQVQIGLGYQSTFDNRYYGVHGQLSLRVGF